MPPPTSTEFLKLVPTGWLRSYLVAMDEAGNEMPLPFHFLAGCVVIGQIIGLEAWATLSKGVRIYPNINALLLAPAGKCRRGEGTKITVKIAERAGVNVLSGKATPEGLCTDLIDRGDQLLYVEELSMLMTKQDFQRPIIPVLTKLLLHGDGSLDMVTKGLGRMSIPYINLSALFTSAPEWFMTTIPEEAFGGGMMSRFIVCCLQDRDRFSIDIQADDSAGQGMMDTLADGLRATRGILRGHIKGTSAANDWIKEWYLKNESAELDDSKLEPHRNRKPANLLRMAMILGAAAGRAELTRTKLEEALRVLDYMEPTLIQLYGETSPILSTMEPGERRILNYLRTQQTAVEHTLLARRCAPYFRGGAREMRHCLLGMVEKGIVTPEYTNGVISWPPRAWAFRKAQ